MSRKNVGASVYNKLKALSREKGIDMQSIVRLYAQQRLLYRISLTEAAERFCLKGGLMLAAYNKGDMMRPTEDIDFNGVGEGTLEEIVQVIQQAMDIEVPDDGVIFDASKMRVIKDREGRVPGCKVVFSGRVHTANVQVRVDVGFNNAITPHAMPMEIPTLLPDVAPRPVVAGYPLETIISEKLHAIAQFGYDNTRHKDYYDIWKILETYEIDASSLAAAIQATFEHQGRAVDPQMDGLSEGFASENERAWRAFLRKTNIKDDLSLSHVIERMRTFILPVIEGDQPQVERWYPDTGWKDLPARLSM